MDIRKLPELDRRDLFKLGMLTAGSALLAKYGLQSTPALASGGVKGTFTAIEVLPTSPLILNPFSDFLFVPTPLIPVPATDVANWKNKPGPGVGQQDSDGGTHQIWPSTLGRPDPIIYQIKVQVNQHSFTTSPVQTLVPYRDTTGTFIPAGTVVPSLPDSTIYGFNGTFPGPMIYANYGQPSLVRFENHLDENPNNRDRGSFGAPDWAFLTHLHNGHTAPESDGNPHYRPNAYQPGQFVDNLYLNYPAGNDEKEKQSFFWFHDHRMDHTGANVYKGMVGIYPIYDPVIDSGDETTGCRLPGVPNLSTGRIDNDLPIILYDCRLDDGATIHQDAHNTAPGTIHPEWWGQTFFQHFPNQGFVGDIFTANGTAYPVLRVQRRRYRLRFLDASISRIYDLKIMDGNGPYKVQAFPGQLGQHNLGQTDSLGNFVRGGQQCMVFTQIASEGGLLPLPLVRDTFRIWPAKRKEVIVDFSKYMDGSPVNNGDVMYLTDTLQMSTGRQPDDLQDPGYAVPLIKIIIDDSCGPLVNNKAVDNSYDPLVYTGGKAKLKLDGNGLPILKLRAMPPFPDPNSLNKLPQRKFILTHGGGGNAEQQWLINGRPFDPTVPLAFPVNGSAEVWTLQNGGGGWVHPLHLHMEEHHIVSRNGKTSPDANHPDDIGKEDVVALEPSETVVIYRKFRTFRGKYVAHCHNLAHEDHAMMFGWQIV